MMQMSFLPQPKYNPKYPPETSLAYKALTLLLGGLKISHPDFETLTGSWRLAAHIHILKRLGWPIQTQEVKLEWQVEDERKRYMGLYYLPNEILDLVHGVEMHTVDQHIAALYP